MKNIFATKKRFLQSGLLLAWGLRSCRSLVIRPTWASALPALSGTLQARWACTGQMAAVTPATQIDKIVSLIPAALKVLVHTTTGLQ